ncbi:MAG: hypothetical protein GY719_26680 [bacterium]|nr:hypothetical protein [bacterium]
MPRRIHREGIGQEWIRANRDRLRERGRADRFAALVIGLLLWTTPLQALTPGKAVDQYQLDVWGADEGLPNSSVWAILQTADGYLWLATYAGLARFDGVRFTVFNAGNTPAMTNDTIYDLAEGPDGSLWVGTYGGGLIRLRDGEWTRYTTREGLLDDRVWVLEQSRDGSLWIGTENGLARLQLSPSLPQGTSRDDRWTSYTAREGLAAELVWDLHEDRAGGLWIATASGLHRLQDGTIRTYTTRDGLGDDEIVTLGEDLEGNLWVGTGGGLSRLDGGSFVSYTTEHGLPGADLETIQADRDGNLWLATLGGGLVRLGSPSGTAKPGTPSGGPLVFEQRAELSTGSLEGILEDREGNLWIGSYGLGLTRLRDTPITTDSTRWGLPNDRVATVYGDREGNLWIGTRGSGLTRLESGGSVTYTTDDGLASNVVNSIHQRRDASLVVGTDAGWSWWVPPEGDQWGQGGRFATPDVSELSLPYFPEVYVIEEDRRGRLWLGTESAGLLALDADRIVTFSMSQGLPHNTVWALFEDRRHDLWIGTNGGLAKLSLGPDAELKDAEVTSRQLPSVSATTFYEDSEGTLWIGTWANGLLRYRQGEFVSYSSEDGLPSSTIYQIVEDDQAHLWLLLDLGIARVAKKQLDDHARGAVAELHARLFNSLDGMTSYAGLGGAQPAGFKSRDGEILFPTVGGLVSIEPSSIRGNPIPPEVIIERVVVDGEPASSEPATRLSRLNLPPGRGELELHFTGVSFSKPEEVRFKYRLDGYDEQWIDAGTRRVAYYTNLAPGAYRFRVTAANEDGVWSETGAQLTFHLEPRFYQTLIFIVASFFGLSLVLGGGISQWRNRRISRRNQALEELDQQRQRFVAELEAKNAEVKAKNEELERFTYTVSHDLKSPLVTIRGFAGLLKAKAAAGEGDTMEQDLERIDDAAAKMGELLDDLLELSRIGRVINRPREVALVEVAHEAVARVAGPIAERGTELEIFPGLPVVSGDPPRLLEVLQNLVENAVKYMGDQPRPLVEIGVRRGADEAVVYVRDNGMGIAPDDHEKIFGLFARLDEQSEGTGIGLALVKRIVDAHGGRIWVESEGRGRGSAFCFTLPEAKNRATLKDQKPAVSRH